MSRVEDAEVVEVQQAQTSDAQESKQAALYTTTAKGMPETHETKQPRWLA